jgi:hypothetical protein
MGETPACFATSCIVTAFRRLLGVLFTSDLPRWLMQPL